VNNPFKSIVVRSVELLYAIEESLRLVEQYEPPVPAFVDVTPKAGTGCGISEAPRGICYHRYRVDEAGAVQDARIVPPTSQNQKQMEDDLWKFAQKNVDLPTDKLTWQCEQAVRNYDPCISCATHALKVDLERI
jgi:sulfhydrogenase subunit alpha